MAVGRPADQARREQRKALRFRNTWISPPGVHSRNHSEKDPNEVERVTLLLRIKRGKSQPLGSRSLYLRKKKKGVKMNCWYRNKLHSTLYYLYWRREKAWAIFPWWFRKSVTFGFGILIKERKLTHIHTFPPQFHAQPWRSPTSVLASSKGLDQWGQKAQNTETDKRELTGLKPCAKHSSHEGHINTSELKSIGFCWYHLQQTPFRGKEETHVTSIEAQNIKRSNGCLYGAINNMQSNYAKEL